MKRQETNMVATNNSRDVSQAVIENSYFFTSYGLEHGASYHAQASISMLRSSQRCPPRPSYNRVLTALLSRFQFQFGNAKPVLGTNRSIKNKLHTLNLPFWQ